jgi:hypothetical protein
MKKQINISDIIVPNKFKFSLPSRYKMNKCREFYKAHRRVDKIITIDSNNNLVDGYIRYLVLLENGVDKVNVKTFNVTYRNSKTTYIFGKHPNVDKEYVWRMTNKTVNKESLEVGSKAVVNTKKGMRTVTVTRVETLDEPPVDVKVKKVYEVL